MSVAATRILISSAVLAARSVAEGYLVRLDDAQTWIEGRASAEAGQ